MKKKGFTLLELLAVIIILAVIALIATPVVLNVVDEAKKSAFQDSAYGLIKSGEYYYTSQILNGGMTSDKVFNFPNNTELEFSGTEPKSGYIKVTKEGLVEIVVSDGKYCATKGLNEDKVTVTEDGESCKLQLNSPIIKVEDYTLYIIPEDDRVEEYEIYVDGVLKETLKVNNEIAINNIKEESNVEMMNTTKTISGAWLFKEMKDMDLPEVGYEVTQNINFKAWKYGFLGYEGTKLKLSVGDSSNTQSCNGESIMWNKYLGVQGYWKYETSPNWYAGSHCDCYDWNGDEIVRLFDFGSTPQEVSDEFYELLTNNAVRVDVNDYMSEISGVWYFNESITFPDNEDTYLTTISNKHIFDLIGISEFEGIKVLGGYSSSNFKYNLFYIDGYGWTETSLSSDELTNFDQSSLVFGDSYRMWDFGSKTQDVKSLVKKIIVENAKKVTTYDLSTLNISTGNHKITVKAKTNGYESSNLTEEVDYTKREIKTVNGVWIFNDTLSISDFGYQRCSFKSNNINYSYIRSALDQAIIYVEDIIAYSMHGDIGIYEGEWNYEAYKTIDFGETPQKVSDEFYDFLTANATKQS